jgi:hypothetical protein
MIVLLSDNDVRGAVNALRQIIEREWAPESHRLDLRFMHLEEAGLRDTSTDREILAWCLSEDAILITADRNASDGEESLDFIISEICDETSMPVMTIGNPNRVTKDRDRVYAEECTFWLLFYLQKIDELRGTRRLWLSPQR